MTSLVPRDDREAFVPATANVIYRLPVDGKR